MSIYPGSFMEVPGIQYRFRAARSFARSQARIPYRSGSVNVRFCTVVKVVVVVVVVFSH